VGTGDKAICVPTSKSFCRIPDIPGNIHRGADFVPGWCFLARMVCTDMGHFVVRSPDAGIYKLQFVLRGRFMNNS
jgi:hypothetical protein